MKSRRALSWLAGALVVTWVAAAMAQAPLRAKPKPPAPRTPPATVGKPPAKPAAAAQVAPGKTATDQDPPGAKGPLPTSMESIAKAVDVPYRPKPRGHMVKFNLQDADLSELVNHISGMTGKRFIYGSKVRAIKATVVSPTPVTLTEAYEAFLSILEANGMTVVPHGRFLKIVDSGGVVSRDTPVYARGAPIPDTDRFITRLYRLKNVGSEEVSALLGKFKSKEGDISIYAPGQLLIITDTGSNIQRMIRIIEEVDIGGAGPKMWIEPINYGSATEMAQRINDIFELGAAGGAGGGGGLSKVVADETSNSLVVIGTEDSYLKLLEFLKRVDAKPVSEGKIHVLPLQHAVAQELAQVLTQMLQGAAAPAARGRGAAPAAGAGTVSGIFESEVRIIADQATNSLVVTSTGRDFAQLRLVVEKLDQPRRQVFIEAVIMDVSVDRQNQMGLSYHGGATADLGGGEDTLIFGGLNPLNTILLPDPNSLQGFALGVRGPGLDGSTNLLGTGLSVPAFGVILNALATSGDANVLSTPHILATDNVQAEINVGENIPLQQNIGGGGLGNLAGLAQAAGGQAAGAGGLGALAGLAGGLGGFSAPRQDVGTRIRVTPHINDSDQVRLEIEEEISEQGAASGNLGAVSITQRTARTTVIVDDQQTVVIGGLMRDAIVKTKEKVPILGDLPVLGFLFRSSTTQTRKTNLLLILTPYVIHDQSDLRKIFQRKMQERQEFIDRYFVFNASDDWTPPRDFERANGLVENIRQAHMDMAERRRLELESQPREEVGHPPSAPIALPVSIAPKPTTGTRRQPVKKKPVPKKKAAPRRQTNPKAPARPATTRQRSELGSPIRINPIARNVGGAVERVE